MKLSEVKASPRKYWLGTVQQIHEIGEFAFVEYENKYGEKGFSIFIQGESTGHGDSTLESALAGAIAYKYDGPNSQAAHFFMRMVGDKEDIAYRDICNRASQTE